MEEQRMGLLVEGSEVSVPLRGVDVEIELSGMFAHTQITQRYRNESDEAIEAIYAFPLPTEGVLLGMEINISGKKLNGIVQGKTQARNTYENAVTGGDGAFLLQQLRDGLYQMNVGNLKPGEEAEIRIRYGEILRWSGNTLRYRLTTVVAPHYGNPSSAGISREDAPKTAPLIDYPLTLGMAIKGDLARAEITSPSHTLEIERSPSSTLVRLGENASLDRDFILTIGMDAPPAWEVLIAPDGDRFAALGCLNVPTMGVPGKAEARDITIVVDCSGSMDGDSIAQARSALLAILDELRDGDSIAILRFGSSIDIWTPKPVRLDKKRRERLRGKICTLEADLGGTEIMKAIRKAVSISKPGADILLITDGEAYIDQAELVKAASLSHRFFTVGVGAAVSETIVRTLADVSGGACELVTPNEHMASRIVAHARRMSMPLAHLKIDWCANEHVRVGRRGVVFAGDTLPVMAVLDRQPSGNPSVTLETEEGNFSHEIPAKTADGTLAEALPRMVAWYRLNEGTDEEDAAEIAVRYQLVSRHTSMVAVLERAADERTDGLPTLAEVPQMLAAGWGGVGSIQQSSVVAETFEPIRFCQVQVDEGVDPVAEADVYMAYGRDAQAEEILLDALKTDPTRTAIHVKLLEIYAGRKNNKQFETLASDLFAQTGGVGGDWEKAAAMGLKLDPANPLYGGGAGEKQSVHTDTTVIVPAGDKQLRDTWTMPGELNQISEDIPAFLREGRLGDTTRTLRSPSMYHLLWAIQERGLDGITGDFMYSLDDPRFFFDEALVELPHEIHEWIENLIQSRQDMGIGEARRAVVLAFLACLLDLVDTDKQRLFRAIRRTVQKEILLHPVPDELHIQVADELRKSTMRKWCVLDVSGKSIDHSSLA